MKKDVISIISSITLFAPIFVFAIDAPETFKELVDLFLGYMRGIIPILMAVAFLMFMWGVAQFIFNTGNKEVEGDAKQKMFWGIIGLFVMVSIWGLVKFLSDSVGISSYIGGF